MCEKYIIFGRLMEIMPEDYMISLSSNGKEIRHCIAWVLKQDFFYYELYDASVLSFSTNYYNDVCTIKIELKPSIRVKGVNEKLDLGFRRRI